jgi:hypothetical protein
MPDYSNGKIYKVVNDVDDAIYIGSTVMMLCNRMAMHRTCAKEDTKRRKAPINVKMRTMGVEHFRIVLIEAFPCNEKSELLRREQHWIDELKPTLNKFKTIEERPQTEVDKERNIRHRERISSYGKAYYQKNKEVVKQRNANYGKIRIDCEICGRNVARKHLKDHQKTQVCKQTLP